MYLRFILMSFLATPAHPDTVAAARTIRANAIIVETDITLIQSPAPQGFSRMSDVIGQEARVVLYPGRPILIDDIGPPAIVTRNQVVRVQYLNNGLSIMTEGRALERGSIGDLVRIMNLSSRATVFGQVQQDGTVQVKH